jgi:hypothetical protein
MNLRDISLKLRRFVTRCFPEPDAEVKREIVRKWRESVLFGRATHKRPCTCHPSEAPVPCQRQYAYSDCMSKVKEDKQ